MDANWLRRLELLRAATVVLAANCAVLVLELSASRLLAPAVGSTLHTWTTIIGVVLLGIALGSFLGGRLADGDPRRRTVALLLLASALTGGLAWLVPTTLGHLALVQAIPILPRTVVLTTLGFLPATLFLSAVTPVLMRQLLPSLSAAGRAAGLLSALGTLGSLVGNYVTGLLLFAYWPVSTIILATALALALLAALAWPRLTDGPVLAPSNPTGEGTSPAPRRAVEPGLLASHPAWPLLLVATTALAMLSLELGASRMLAPVLRVSIISWTGIIGVVLVGIAAGNTLGGYIADRAPRVQVVSTWLALSALACFLVVPIHSALVLTQPFDEWTYIPRVLAHSAAVFLLPVTLLATVSPQVVRLSLTTLASAGRTSGTLWAAGTVGALLGAFLTGWLLIGTIGSYAVMAATAALLLVAAVVVGQAWRDARLLGLSVATASLGAVLAWAGALRSPCTAESDYYCIFVVDRKEDGRSLRGMQLDSLLHSTIDLADPDYLGYPHLEMHAERLGDLAARVERPRLLLIGGGGYSLPRWLRRHLPTIEVDVVEIDPAVTRVALERFDLPRDSSVRSFALDGRQFIQEFRHTGQYDVIIQDAVNDFAVPWHLVTREYFSALASRLKPGGLFFLSVIDKMPSGPFLPAVLRTLRASFPDVVVTVPSHRLPRLDSRAVYVFQSSAQPLDLEGLKARTTARGATPFTSAVDATLVEQALTVLPGLSFTDDYAPVENMMAALFLESEDRGRR